jgi:hypothetical protein
VALQAGRIVGGEIARRSEPKLAPSVETNKWFEIAAAAANKE